MASRTLVFLLPFLLFSAARGSDTEALRLLLADLGGDLLRPYLAGARHIRHPCRLPGVVCERRNGALRAVRVAFPSLGLDGSLSPVLGKLSEMQELSLPGNLLSGGIPAEIAGCRRLRMLDLGGNALSGEVPREISSLAKLRALDLSGNQFQGDLGFLTLFPNLENLSLADNHFTGQVPPFLSSFRSLRFLDLSGNPGLRGPFPDLPAAAVEVVPLNRRGRAGDDGTIPKRYVFAEGINTTDSRLSRGGGLIASAPALAPSASKAANHPRRKRKLSRWILGFFVGAPAGILSGIVVTVLLRLLLNCCHGRKRRRAGPAIFSPLVKAKQLAFLEEEEDLESLEVIGRGGCGVVYRAALPSEPRNTPAQTLAIKKIMMLSADGEGTATTGGESQLPDRWMRQIWSEITTVGHVRHRNLLPLLAHVPRPDCHLLVYEYMKNGSLQDALWEDADGRRELDWPTRQRVVTGIAAGLEHLHTQHSPRIIHRDLKPANILLDDNMEARIADFGLATAVPDAITHVTASNVAGTIGYIAPEYHGTLKFTDKCDIYSFGVILAVVVTGKAPSDEFFLTTAEMGLVKWVRNLMGSGQAEAAMDPKLRGKGHEEQMELVLRVACLCTVDNPKKRPNSKEVRCMLSQINAAKLHQPPSATTSF